MTNMPHQFHHRGFTLIEVLIAMAIFAILSVLSYSGLQSVIDSKTQTEAQLERLQALQTSLMTISADMQFLVNRQSINALGSDLHSLSTENSDYLIEITRNSWRNPSASQARSTLQRVAYHLDEDKLIRTYWRYIDRADDEAKVDRTLIQNIESLEFRFMDEDNEWQSSWPTPGMLTGGTITLPKAVEIKLNMGDWGEIIRLVKVIP